MTFSTVVGIGLEWYNATGVGALASYLLNTPIGVGGGAVFGTLAYLIGKPIAVFATKDLDRDVESRSIKLANTIFSNTLGFGCSNVLSFAFTNMFFGKNEDFITEGLALSGVNLAFLLPVIFSVGYLTSNNPNRQSVAL